MADEKLIMLKTKKVWCFGTKWGAHQKKPSQFAIMTLEEIILISSKNNDTQAIGKILPIDVVVLSLERHNNI